MKKLISIYIFTFLLIPLFASDHSLIINDANKAYSEGQYADAIELYEQLINNGLESPELYYNLGNSYFKINDLPSAILYYEKAIKLDPGDEDVIFNLKVANSMIPDKIEEVPLMFYKRWWNSIYDLFGANMWAKLSVFCLIAFLLMLAIYFAGNSYFIKKTFFWFALIFFVFTIFSFSFSFQKYNTIEFYTNYNGEVSYKNLAPSERDKAYMYAKDADGNPYSPAWFTINLKASYQLTSKLKIDAGIENILDYRYRPYSSGICASGRNFIIAIRGKLGE
ncbi:MAG: TonB-dependent receptor [Bacteroidales bacterium]|nr:TonB-dependent receptor [Bacteroidales bacterium]